MNPAYSVVIFDLDGTLLDTLADIAEAANCVLQSLGYPTHAYDTYRRFVGEGVATLFSRALPAEAVSDEQLARCMEGFREVYSRQWNIQTRIYDGVRPLLDALQQRGVRLAVLSNKPDAFTKLCIEHYLAPVPFEVVLGQRESVPRKPHPAAVGEILELLGEPVERCLYLGDSDVDMQTATAAGVFPVGALWGFRTAKELSASGARALIGHPLELLDLLETPATDGS
jgi:phosphoglycolate phosphatase